MMAIYLWEVHYLIENGPREEPVMAAFNFVMSDAFRLWNNSNPVDLDRGIYRVVKNDVPDLPPSDPRVRDFDLALLMISARAGPSTPAPPKEYDAGSDFETDYEYTEPFSYFDNTTGPEGAPDEPLGTYRGVPAFTGVDSDDDDSESAEGASGGVESSNESPYVNDAVQLIMASVREKNPELHNSFYFVFHLYALLRVYPTYQAMALSRALATFMESQNMKLPFNGSLPTQTLVTDVIVSGISENIQSLGKDKSTPEGLILRELTEYCLIIQALLKDDTVPRTITYSDIVEIGFVNFFANEEFQNFANAEKKNILTSETEERMLEAIGKSNVPFYKQKLLQAAIAATALFSVAAMVSVGTETEGQSQAGRGLWVPREGEGLWGPELSAGESAPTQAVSTQLFDVFGNAIYISTQEAANLAALPLKLISGVLTTTSGDLDSASEGSRSPLMRRKRAFVDHTQTA